MASRNSRGGVAAFVRANSLSLFFLAIFLAALVGQAISGHTLYNQDQTAHHEAPISFWRYLTSSHFAQGVMENWQSEYLQFALFALATVWLLQRGSPESRSSTRPAARAIASKRSAATRRKTRRAGRRPAGFVCGPTRT